MIETVSHTPSAPPSGPLHLSQQHHGRFHLLPCWGGRGWCTPGCRSAPLPHHGMSEEQPKHLHPSATSQTWQAQRAQVRDEAAGVSVQDGRQPRRPTPAESENLQHGLNPMVQGFSEEICERGWLMLYCCVLLPLINAEWSIHYSPAELHLISLSVKLLDGGLNHFLTH